MTLSGEQIEIASGAQRVVITSVGATLRCVRGRRPRGRSTASTPTRSAPADAASCSCPGPTASPTGRYELAGTAAAAPDRRAGARPRHPRPRPLGRVADRDAQAADARSAAPSAGARGPAIRSRSSCSSSIGCRRRAGGDLRRHQRRQGALSLRRRRASLLPLRRTCTADAVELCVARRRVARGRRALDSHGAPSRSSGSTVDFRRPRVIGAAHVDHAFTHLERDAEGLAQRPPARGAARAAHLARSQLRLRAGLHRRHAAGSGASPSGRRRRADELRAQRVQQRRRPAACWRPAARSRAAGASRRERQAARARLRERVLAQRSPRSRRAGGVLRDPRLVSVRHVRADADRIHPAARARSSGHRRRSSDRAARRRQAGRVDPCRDHSENSAAGCSSRRCSSRCGRPRAASMAWRPRSTAPTRCRRRGPCGASGCARSS